MRLDLHVHTTASDGSCDPADVVARAVSAGLDILAISDHDTVAGVGPALEAATGQPIQVIRAIELSSTWNSRELHILGYFVDIGHGDLADHQIRAKGRRAERIREMIVRLRDLGVDVDEGRVFAYADEASVGRPHLAKAMVEAGVVSSADQAFEHWIGDAHEAFVPTAIHTPFEAVELIHAAGGQAVWAHPPRDVVESLTPELAEAGLDGLEVYRPSHSATYTETLERLAGRHRLVRTGGSDWHGPSRGPLGDFFVEAREVAEFLEKGGI